MRMKKVLTMGECIEREAVLRAVHGQRSPCRSPAQNRMLDCLKAAVIRISAADVAPVVHGRWMKRRNGGTLCSRCGHYTQYKGQVLDMSEAIACPWCGAMMDGGTE